MANARNKNDALKVAERIYMRSTEYREDNALLLLRSPTISSCDSNMNFLGKESKERSLLVTKYITVGDKQNSHFLILEVNMQH